MEVEVKVEEERVEVEEKMEEERVEEERVEVEEKVEGEKGGEDKEVMIQRQVHMSQESVHRKILCTLTPTWLIH